MRILTNKKKERKRNIKSLDRKFSDDGKNNTLLHQIPDPRANQNDTLETYSHICHCAERVLNGKKLEYFNMYYKDGLTLEEIGSEKGTSRQNVSLHIISGIKAVKQWMVQHNYV